MSSPYPRCCLWRYPPGTRGTHRFWCDECGDWYEYAFRSYADLRPIVACWRAFQTLHADCQPTIPITTRPPPCSPPTS